MAGRFRMIPRYFFDLRRLFKLILTLFGAGLVLIWFNPNWVDKSVHKIQYFDPALDISDPLAQRQLCLSHGWGPFSTRGRQRKIYDLIMINTELDWLEIRLNSTYDYVDWFVIVESKKTFTNMDKPLVIKENMDRFAAYKDKIIYHELIIPEGFHSDRSNPAWDWEDLQRNAMYDQVLPFQKDEKKPNIGDVLLVADVDELVRPETLVVLRACNFPRRLTLRSHFYYYSFQWRHKGLDWPHPQATYYQGRHTLLPTNLRIADGGLPPLVKLESAELLSAGWHCSSCFSTIGELLTKMSSFSHQWMNQEAFRDRDRIVDHIRNGRDIWDREGQEYIKIGNNRDIPKILLNDPERFLYLTNRDGPSAGFTDYP